jgi:hypothetical protein
MNWLIKKIKHNFHRWFRKVTIGVDVGVIGGDMSCAVVVKLNKEKQIEIVDYKQGSAEEVATFIRKYRFRKLVIEEDQAGLLL